MESRNPRRLINPLWLEIDILEEMCIMIDIPILLVEDNPDDVLIMRRSWKKRDLRNSLYVVNDGEEALQFLKREGNYAGAPTPGLILLDLNMPKKDGFEVLENIKRDKLLRSIPVIILTSSDRDKDIKSAYQLGCNCYIVKPVSSKKLDEIVFKIGEFWLNLCKTPSCPS